ncbi:MAG: class I SAM-dependent methyltransferase [Sphingobacteriaceae bacterium]
MEEKFISSGVKAAYDEYYQSHDEQWRLLGARYKAEHIAAVCQGHSFQKVLEVGAGDGSILHFLDQWNFAPELHALEISKSGVEHIQAKNIHSLKSVQEFDGYHIPFPDDSFDLVILAHVLEHVEHERLLLREIKRVSKFQVIEVPKDYRFGVDLRMKHFLDYGHINMYTPTSLRFLLQSEGFKILADLNSLIHPEVTRFNTFINQKKPNSWFNRFRISLEYGIKKLWSVWGGKKQEEKLANAYTVLSTKETNLQIF